MTKTYATTELTESDKASLKCSWGDAGLAHVRGKADAVQKANALLDKMKGNGPWTAIVGENLGWHYHVQSGNLKVYEHSIGHYSCLLGTFGGEMFWSLDGSWDDPNEAVKAQLQKAEEFIRGCQSMVDEAKAAMA